MKKINRKIYEILFIFISSLTPLVWFIPNQIILGHDSGFRLDPLKQLEMLFYSWNPANNFGADWSFFKGFLVIQFPEAAFTALTHSVWLGQRMTLIFWFFLMGISIYYCLNYFFSKKEQFFLRIFGTLFYTYNFFILQGWFIAERAKFSLYAALPIGFLFLYKTLTKKLSLLKGTIFFSLLFFFLNGGGSPPLYGAIFLTYGIVFVYLTALLVKENGLYELFFSLRVVIAFIVGALAVNAYFIVPQIYFVGYSYLSSLSSSGGLSGVLAWEGIISKNASILNLLRLEGIPDWYENPFHPYSHNYLTNPILIFLSFLPFFIILLGFLLFKAKKSKIIYLILLIFFSSVIFTGGTHPPTGFLYESLMRYIPGFVVFRSSYYKFAPALFFSLSVLIAFYLQSLISVLRGIKRKTAYVFVGIFFVIFNLPYFNSNFFSFNKPFTTKVTLPTYVIEMSDYLKKHVDSSTKILLLPDLDPSLNSDNYVWGYWSLDVLPRVLTDNNFIASDSYNDLVKNMYRAVKEKNESLFLDIAQRLGIKKILWRGDILYSDKSTKAEDVVEYKNSLENFLSIKLQKSIGKWRLYTITDSNTLPLFYPVSDISQVLSNDLHFIDINSLTASSTSVWITEQTYISEDILRYISQKVVGTPCESCSLKALDHVRDQLAMPANVSLLPWSKFYMLVSYKEKKILVQTENNPNQRIDADLSLENTRLVEIWRMAFKDFNKDASGYITQNAQKYKNLVNDSLVQLNKLSDLQKNNYIVKMIAYTRLQKDYIRNFNENLLIKNDINDLFSYMDSVESLLQGQVWISSSNEDRKSYLAVPDNGNYQINILPSDQIEKILFNNKEINNFDTLSLKSGNYTIEAQYAQQDNFIKNFPGSMSMKKGDVISFPILPFSYTKSYYYKFTYNVDRGGYVKLIVNQNNPDAGWSGGLATPIISDLYADGRWHTILNTFTPSSGASRGSVSLVAQRDSKIAVSSAVIQELIDPAMIIDKKLNSQLSQPKVTYKKVDTTAFILSVSDVKSPWILDFNQTFNVGWKAYVTKENFNSQPLWLFCLKSLLFNKAIPEDYHLALNGYSNGWYFDHKGDYTVLIIFLPQVYFYVGLLISLVSLIVMGGLYDVYRHKN